MALLSDTDPDPTPRSTLCCDSTVEAYKHSGPEKKGKKRKENNDRRGGLDSTGESQRSVLRGVGSGFVSNRSAIARHEANFLSWLSGLSS